MSKTLAEIVLDEGLTDRARLSAAAREADAQSVPLVVALVRNGGLDEVALVAAIRRQMRVPIADPAEAELDPEAVRELPRDVCYRRRVVPVRVHIFATGPRSLELAMADPSDTVAAAEVEHLTGCRVERVLMTLSAVEELIERAYKGFVTEVMRRDGKASYRGGQPSASAGAAPREPADPRVTQPTTIPHHHVADEADAATRLEALVELLVDRGVIERADLDERIRALLKR